MSALADSAVLIFGLWLLASIGYVLPAPRIHALLARLNWFRTFCGWALFVEVRDPAQYGAYTLEYRDHDAAGTPGAWTVATTSGRTRLASVLLDTHSPIASGLFSVARALEHAVAAHEHQPASLTTTRRRLEQVLSGHLAATRSRPAGSTREIRLVKRFGARLTAHDAIVWSFRGVHD
jgi:hypothetical protein